MTTDRPSNGVTDALSYDKALALVSPSIRRAAILALQDDATRSLDDLASAVARDDNGAPDDLDLLRQRLHHCHLPQLDTAGVVDYDADRHRVDYLGDETVETVLSRFDA